MGRKSSIERAPPLLKARIESFLRQNRLTLDEMCVAIQQEFGVEAAPSRSALHRYQRGFDEMLGRMREIDAAANALVGELGEGVGEKAGALLAHAVTTLANNAAFRANEDPETSIDDVRKLAIAARNAMESRRLSLNERKAIEQETRERLLREQQSKLATMERKPGIDAGTLRRIREEVYGLS